MLADLLRGLERRGAFSDCDLIMSGYLGNAALAAVVSDTVARVRAANGDVMYCCDPVMGDDGSGLYVDPALPDYFTTAALPAADIATPNLFELEMLCGLEAGALKAAPVTDIVAAGRDILGCMRPGACIMVTSVVHRDLDPAHVAVIAINDSEAGCVETPRLDFPSAPHGAGDLVSALFAAAMTQRRVLARALEDSVATVFAVLSQTHQRSASELELVAARDEVVSPALQFTARPVG